LAETLPPEARAEYDAGKLLFGDGDYAGALVKFQKAATLSNNPRLLWNMAACEKNLRHYSKALPLVERYQAAAGSALTAQDRSEAEALVSTLRAFVSMLRITANEDGATVLVDDEPVGTTPLASPVLVDVGTRRIRVTKAGFHEAVISRQVVGAEPLTLQVDLVKELTDGRLVVRSNEPRGSIQIDGRTVGEGSWEGRLANGGHTLVVSAPQRKTYQTEVYLQPGQLRTVSVTLEDNRVKGGASAWPWITGGAAVAAAAAVGGFFLFRPQDQPAPAPVAGTIAPGSVQLP